MSLNDEGISRRRFLGFAAGAVGAITALSVGVPLLSTAVSPAVRKQTTQSPWTEVGNTKDFATGKPSMVKWSAPQKDGYLTESADRSAWVYTEDGQAFTVWNPRCTHLGCAYSYNEQKKQFDCPCHGGVFSIPDGKVVAGPPPRPLDTLDTRIENGKLYVMYADFKLGVGEKASV